MFRLSSLEFTVWSLGFGARGFFFWEFLLITFGGASYCKKTYYRDEFRPLNRF